MKSLAGFFEKFQGKIGGQIQNLIVISETIKKHTNIEVDMKNISITAGILRLKVSSLEKSEVFMKKERILKEINQKVRSLVIKDLQ